MIERFFMPPQAPLPNKAAEWLIVHFSDILTSKSLSFRDKLIIAPTKAASRNIRDRFLKELLKKNIYGISYLNIDTFESLFANLTKDYDTANIIDRTAAWIRTYNRLNFNDYLSLFPNSEISKEDFIDFSKEIESLQKSLLENMMTISDASQVLQDETDSLRWIELSKIEKIFFEELNTVGKITQETALIHAVKNPSKLEYDEVIIIGNPDLSGLIQHFIDKNKSTKVSILIFAEEEYSKNFDKFGNPLESIYLNKHLPIKDEKIFLASSVQDEADMIVNLASEYDKNVYEAISLSCDEEKNSDFFISKFEEKNILLNSLEPENLGNTALFSLLKTISNYFESENFDALFDIAKNPYFFKFLKDYKLSDILSSLDNFKNESFPRDFNTVTSNEKIFKILNFAKKIFLIDSNNYLLDLKQNLKELIENFLKSNNDIREYKAYLCISCIFEKIDIAEKNFGIKFKISEILNFLIGGLESETFTENEHRNSLFIHDWMEIFYSNNPHVVLADFNDSIVPLADSNGFFLNDRIRKKLGLRSQTSRQTRDTYMLETLYNSRSGNGYDCSIIIPRKNIDSDPIFASRIILQSDNIANRVKRLFEDPKEIITTPRFTPSWKLEVSDFEIKKEISVTKFKTFLDSQWHFYLEFINKINVVNPYKMEMDAMQYGSVIHSIVEDFGRSDLSDSDDAEKIKIFLLSSLDKYRTLHFGKSPRTQILLQFASIAQRLSAFAEVQSNHRKNGWKILNVELPFRNFIFNDWIIKGKIDRIDQNEKNGRIAVLDYKTFEKISSNTVIESHIKLSKSGNTEHRWLDLQLPIYRMFALKQYNIDSIDCGYILLPKNVIDTQIQFWNPLPSDNPNFKGFIGDEIFLRAEEKILEILNVIESKKLDFSQDPKYDSYKDIFGVEYDTLKRKVLNV